MLDNSTSHRFPVLVLLLYLLKGIFPLSKTEIKKDVREMERSMHDDTDSDGSVMSDDVLPSTYPVKPRKTAKIPLVQRPSAMSSADAEAAEYDSKMVEQTLTFLDSVKRNKKDLYHVECERERLESQALVRFYSHMKLIVTSSLFYNPVYVLGVVVFYSHIVPVSKNYHDGLNKKNGIKETMYVSCKVFMHKLCDCKWC